MCSPGRAPLRRLWRACAPIGRRAGRCVLLQQSPEYRCPRRAATAMHGARRRRPPPLSGGFVSRPSGLARAAGPRPNRRARAVERTLRHRLEELYAARLRPGSPTGSRRRGDRRRSLAWLKTPLRASVPRAARTVEVGEGHPAGRPARRHQSKRRTPGRQVRRFLDASGAVGRCRPAGPVQLVEALERITRRAPRPRALLELVRGADLPTSAWTRPPRNRLPEPGGERSCRRAPREHVRVTARPTAPARRVGRNRLLQAVDRDAVRDRAGIPAQVGTACGTLAKTGRQRAGHCHRAPHRRPARRVLSFEAAWDHARVLLPAVEPRTFWRRRRDLPVEDEPCCQIDSRVSRGAGEHVESFGARSRRSRGAGLAPDASWRLAAPRDGGLHSSRKWPGWTRPSSDCDDGARLGAERLLAMRVDATSTGEALDLQQLHRVVSRALAQRRASTELAGCRGDGADGGRPCSREQGIASVRKQIEALARAGLQRLRPPRRRDRRGKACGAPSRGAHGADAA